MTKTQGFSLDQSDHIIIALGLSKDGKRLKMAQGFVKHWLFDLNFVQDRKQSIFWKTFRSSLHPNSVGWLVLTQAKLKPAMQN